MTSLTPIAVVGMGGVFPSARGGVFDGAALWEDLAAGRGAARDVPAGRWVLPPAIAVSPGAPRPDRVLHARGCFVDAFSVDASDLDCDPQILAALDPVYHFALHAGRAAWRAAQTAALDRRRVGVALAALALPTDGAAALTREMFGPDFERRVLGQRDAAARTEWTRTHPLNRMVTALPAALLARALNLGGGALTLDAACASGLYAIKIACDALREGRADAMLAGGVSRPDALFTQMGFTQLHALSPSGVCAPFAARADGLVVGEAAAVVMLKRLEDALRDGDEVWGLIRAVGVSNDMSGSLLAPSSEGQLRAMRSAYDAAGWRPGDVDAIECHGTGTPVGDAVETASYRALWADEKKSKRCALGSVKSALGHTLTAAGAVGLVKKLLGMRAAKLAPTLNMDAPNPACALEGGHFHVPTEAIDWERARPGALRRAAVSAFGFGGINAHLLFEEWNPAISREQDRLAVEPALPMFVADAAAAPQPIAIVGMAIEAGDLRGLRAAEEAYLRGDVAIAPRPASRRIDPETIGAADAALAALPGNYASHLDFSAAAHRLPPSEISEILPQQLWMLAVAADAMRDAGMDGRDPQPRVGAVVGMNFDMNATNYHLRWWAEAESPRWARALGLEEGSAEHAAWRAALLDAAGPALNAPRVMGALGNIMANRIARRFALGGPSFAISGEELSGLRALEFACRAIQRGELDAALVGAADFAADLRHLRAADAIAPWSRSGERHPLDALGDGACPAEAAVALVLKPLDAALAAGDRIYATISGLGFASAMERSEKQIDDNAAQHGAVQSAWEDARLEQLNIGLLEIGGAFAGQEFGRAKALSAAYAAGESRAVALSSFASGAGQSGAAAGLVSVAAAAMALDQQMLPALPNFEKSAPHAWDEQTFFAPRWPQVWLRNRAEGPRRAAVDAVALDGGHAHVLLEESPAAAQAHPRAALAHRQPLGARGAALFCVAGETADEITRVLDPLHAFAQNTITGIETMARGWHAAHPAQRGALGLAIVANDAKSLRAAIQFANRHLASQPASALRGEQGVFYAPAPLGPQAGVAFVFPGSGNHYAGMGRGLRTAWPEVLRALDTENEMLRAQLMPDLFLPERLDWSPGWEVDAARRIAAAPRELIFAQVAHSCVISDLLRKLGLRPSAALGYSLGESKAYFALRVWRDRDRMLRRMLASPLFSETLAGDCTAAHAHWGLSPAEPADWRVAVVNRAADDVRAALSDDARVYVLIVNAPGECVIGGWGPAVEACVRRLGAEAHYLEGVPTVHCAIAGRAEEAYRALHLLPVTPLENMTIYSAAYAAPVSFTSEACADSIVAQALRGFDFPAVVERAYADGVRAFIEIGPRASCSRMIGRILGERPHMARSACLPGEDDVETVLNVLAECWAQGVWRDVAALYGEPAQSKEIASAALEHAAARIPLTLDFYPSAPPAPATAMPVSSIEAAPAFVRDVQAEALETAWSLSTLENAAASDSMFAALAQTQAATSRAHATYLHFAQESMHAIGALIAGSSARSTAMQFPQTMPPPPPAAFPREKCMAFAVGRLAEVLGPAFAEVDAFPVRVRFPAEPLMLCDRILFVEGAINSLTHARCVTEHDVLPGAWYLDQDRAPACIAIEAGQADLFLCSYLGIDLRVRGARAYRLLNADVTFHRGLPRPGDVLRYDIRIDRFIRQGDVYLFFFRYEGTVNGEPMLTMRNGQAGFFSPEEIEAGLGIVHKPGELDPAPGRLPADWRALASMRRERYDDAQIAALRRGDLAACFGADFARFHFADPPRLPSGRMRLLDRVIDCDPAGGRFGLGLIVAEYDVHPDDWFLTCHFIDDMTMPGTLMYQCCEHTLRVFLWRMGWVCEQTNIAYEPRMGLEAKLACRGPVTQATRKITYELHIKELGYGPAPFAVADAYMYSDGKKMVQFIDMSMQLTGAQRSNFEDLWNEDNVSAASTASTMSTPSIPCTAPLAFDGASVPAGAAPAIFDRSSIVEFCEGDPSRAFGEKLRPFDRDGTRKLARLPRDPYRCIDRVTRLVDAPPWQLVAGAMIDAQWDITGAEWFWRAKRQTTMPFAILLEHGLQGCGWLAAYGGAALRSAERLRFRNLGGTGTLLREIPAAPATLTTRLRQTSVSEAGGMIILAYAFQIWSGGALVYDATTQFGFFTEAALAQQVGLRDAQRHAPDAAEMARHEELVLPDFAPYAPDDARGEIPFGASLPARALRMIDAVEVFIPDGGPHGLGFMRGIKDVNPEEWFFEAHFFEDPVVPGSLGLESMLQLMKAAMLARWPELAATHRFEAIGLRSPHTWTYRGQVIPSARRMTTELVVTRVEHGAAPAIVADGLLLCDGLPIYGMKDFTMRLVPVG